MALHGKVEVNNTAIGSWEAVRHNKVSPTPLPDDYLIYDCRVYMLETLEGNPAIDWQGEVLHRFGDGALALASKVLAHAYEELEHTQRLKGMA